MPVSHDAARTRNTLPAGAWRDELVEREASASFSFLKLLSTSSHALKMPGLLLGQTFPDFEAEATTGTIKFHEYLGDS